MKVSNMDAALYAALLARSAMAKVDPPTNGNILACKAEGCDDCPLSFPVTTGHPACEVLASADILGTDFVSNNTGGNGYDVWWDSGPPQDTCQLVVRTPASTDLPACGYYLTSWSQEGCYYTSVMETFMLQFCCGTGDCDAASPAATIEEARAQALVGKTAYVNIGGGSVGKRDSGKETIEGVGEVSWKRSDYAYSKREEISKPVEVTSPKLDRRADGDCIFHPTSDLVTEGGQQVKASDTNVCNTQGGCAIAASVAITTGETISPMLTGTFFGAIAAAVGYSFTTSTTYMVTNTYTQTQGTTGYLSYIPTNNCWDGTFENCYAMDGDNIFKIDEGMTYHACTPALRSGGQLDGTFSFVYDNA